VEIRNLIRRLSKRSTILFSTHILPEVEQLCDRVIILMNGKVRRDARLTELSDTNDAVLILEKHLEEVEPALRGLDGVQQVFSPRMVNEHAVYQVSAESGLDLCPAIYQLASQHDWPLRELRREVQTLETVFNKLAVAA